MRKNQKEDGDLGKEYQRKRPERRRRVRNLVIKKLMSGVLSDHNMSLQKCRFTLFEMILSKSYLCKKVNIS